MEGVRLLTGLTEVTLANLQLSPASMNELAHVLSACSKLTHLTVDNVPVGNDGIQGLLVRACSHTRFRPCVAPCGLRMLPPEPSSRAWTLRPGASPKDAFGFEPCHHPLHPRSH